MSGFFVSGLHAHHWMFLEYWETSISYYQKEPMMNVTIDEDMISATDR